MQNSLRLCHKITRFLYHAAQAFAGQGCSPAPVGEALGRLKIKQIKGFNAAKQHLHVDGVGRPGTRVNPTTRNGKGSAP
jgi:hypothetical protein